MAVNGDGRIYPSSNLFNSHSPSRSIHGVLFLQTNAYCSPSLLTSSTPSLVVWLPLAPHFKLLCFSQNVPIVPPHYMPVPSHSICFCHLNHCFLQSQHLHQVLCSLFLHQTRHLDCKMLPWLAITPTLT